MARGKRVTVSSDLELGADALQALADALRGDAHPVADPYAEAVLETARSAAGGHPTPQSRMAASGLTVSHGVISGAPGTIVQGAGGDPVSLGSILYGAEWGSNTYHQFPRARRSGYWLYPSANKDGPVSAADRALESLLERIT